MIIIFICLIIILINVVTVNNAFLSRIWQVLQINKMYYK